MTRSSRPAGLCKAAASPLFLVPILSGLVLSGARAVAAPLPVLGAVPAAPSSAGTDGEEKKSEADAHAFTLENLFPEKSFFGPSASALSFSTDGRYASWLYRPYAERRHGNDLHLLDTTTGEVRRITMPSVMAPFQSSARKVAEDRFQKAEARAKKEKDAEKAKDGAEAKEGDTKAGDGKAEEEKAGEERHWSDVVGDDDADDEKAPRHSGVSNFVWSPVGDELLFVSEGDVYRLSFGEDGAPRIERATKTRASESSLEYLPDGSGYTWSSGNSIAKVVFGSHHQEEIQPQLPSGQTIAGYSLSPDGKKLVVLGSTGSVFGGGGGRRVNIASYRDRFMQVREVERMVSDDPVPEVTTDYYLYELPDPMVENGRLTKVYTHKATGPRDALPTPDWAPDSSRFTFARFAQDDARVKVFEVKVPGKDEKLAVLEQAPKEEPKEDEDTRQLRQQFGIGRGGSTEDPIHDWPAKLVHQFLHDGGPNTPSMIQPRYLADSRSILLLTEQSGFRQLHVLDPLYESLRQVTSGNFEVYPLDLPPARDRVFFQSTSESTTCLDVSELDPVSGAIRRLTKEAGVYSPAAVSPSGKFVLAQYAVFGRLPELTLTDTESGELRTLTDSHPEIAKFFTTAAPEFFEYQNRHGHSIHGMMFKPADWTPEVKRPLLIYVYGGPLGTRKQVVQGSYQSDAYFFARYMAEKHGYVTCTIDPRGMSGYGAMFEKANFEQVGKPQVEDLVDGVKWMVEHAAADPKKVGIHGWSFGGFQTQMCLYTEPDVFQVGMAGAGPTEWENYNKWYSTGTIGETRTGKPDLSKYSLLPLAKNLKGKLLLIHGMEDSNVLYQDTVRVYSELLKAGKETLVELFLDPTGGHGLGGLVQRLGRYRKYEEFLLRNLGEGELPPAAPATAEKS